MLLERFFDPVQIDTAELVRIRHRGDVDDVVEVPSMRQIVGVVLHNGGDDHPSIGSFFLQGARNPVDPAGGSTAYVKRGVTLGIRFDERQDHVVRPFELPSRQLGAKVHVGVRI